MHMTTSIGLMKMETRLKLHRTLAEILTVLDVLL